MFQRVDSFFTLDKIQTVLISDNASFRKQLNLDFSPEVSPGKQVTFLMETPEVYQQINPTPILYKAAYFSD